MAPGRIQKAVLVKDIGNPVQLGTREIPSPRQGQVLVRVTATMLLPHDTYGRDWGILIDQKLPAVLGSNVAGVVEELGTGVNLELGQRVFGISFPEPGSSDQGGLQEYAILNANAICKTPDEFSDEQVVTLPINLVTSWTVLFTQLGFNIPPTFAQRKDFDYASTSIVIIGGGTNVGQFAVQLAHTAGIGKIIVVAGAANQERLKAMGATHFIDRHATPADVAQQSQMITGEDGAVTVYNCAQLQPDLAIAVLSATKPSRLRLLLPLEDSDAQKLKLERPLCDAAFIEDLTNDSMAPYSEQFWEEVPQWLRADNVLPTKYKVVEGLEKVEEINQALDEYRDLARGGAQTVVKIHG